MGGAAPQPSGKGGKKPLDAVINLVPFIDLLSCCISFLLITAVWTQLARMNVNQKTPGPSQSTPENQQPEVQLTVYLNKDGYIFAQSTGEQTNIPLKDGDYDYAKLGETLAKAKSDHPDKNDISLKSDDDIVYEKIIRTMDTMISQKFPDVALSDKGGG